MARADTRGVQPDRDENVQLDCGYKASPELPRMVASVWETLQAKRLRNIAVIHVRLSGMAFRRRGNMYDFESTSSATHGTHRNWTSIQIYRCVVAASRAQEFSRTVKFGKILRRENFKNL